jgi:hypothetical protein
VIYFIQGIDGGPVKIGYTSSSDAQSRLASIQTGSPVKLIVRATLPGNVIDEAEWHRRFAEHRLSGEWFRATNGLADAIGQQIVDRREAGVVERPLAILSGDRVLGPLAEKYQAVVDVMTHEWQWMKEARERHPLLREMRPSVPSTIARALVYRGWLEGRRLGHRIQFRERQVWT